jgi:hypothetical protein
MNMYLSKFLLIRSGLSLMIGEGFLMFSLLLSFFFKLLGFFLLPILLPIKLLPLLLPIKYTRPYSDCERKGTSQSYASSINKVFHSILSLIFCSFLSVSPLLFLLIPSFLL